MKLQYLFSGFVLLVLTGCYTQLGRIPEPMYPERSTNANSQMISSANKDSVQQEADSTGQRQGHTELEKDTVFIERYSTRTCYWGRDFFGRPELFCSDSPNYRPWYLHYSSPWWIDDPLYACPDRYFWDFRSNSCRYYNDYYRSHRWGSDRYWYGSTPRNYHPGSSRPSSESAGRDPRKRGGFPQQSTSDNATSSYDSAPAKRSGSSDRTGSYGGSSIQGSSGSPSSSSSGSSVNESETESDRQSQPPQQRRDPRKRGF